jgi:hypothetical protein
MNKNVSDEEWVDTRKALLKKEKLYVKFPVVAALAVMILAAAPSALNRSQTASTPPTRAAF